MTAASQSYMVVGAIDFGTTYSGYAYSFRSDFTKDPLSISTTNWENEGDGTHKVPTTILFDDKQRFHSFGYAAEKKFADLANADESDEEEERKPEGDVTKWFYFRRFKMALFKEASQDVRPRVRKLVSYWLFYISNQNIRQTLILSFTSCRKIKSKKK